MRAVVLDLTWRADHHAHGLLFHLPKLNADLAQRSPRCELHAQRVGLTCGRIFFKPARDGCFLVVMAGMISVVGVSMLMAGMVVAMMLIAMVGCRLGGLRAPRHTDIFFLLRQIPFDRNLRMTQGAARFGNAVLGAPIAGYSGFQNLRMTKRT